MSDPLRFGIRRERLSYQLELFEVDDTGLYTGDLEDPEDEEE